MSSINLLNLILLSYSNGFTVSSTYVICSDYVSEKFKNKFAVGLSMFISFGVTFGSFYATFVINQFML